MQHPEALPWDVAVCYQSGASQVYVTSAHSPGALHLSCPRRFLQHQPLQPGENHMAQPLPFLYKALLFFFSLLGGFFSNKVTSDLTDNIRAKNNPCVLPSPAAQRVKLRTGKTRRKYMYPKMPFPYFLTLSAPETPIISCFTAMASLS